MNVVFFTHLTIEFPHMTEALIKKFPEHNFILARNKEEYKKALSNAHILIFGNPSDDDIEIAVSLKLIIVPYAGVSQLNFLLLSKKSIKVANSHGNAPIVAEQALALAMSCCGRVVEFHNDQRVGNWHRTGDHNKPFDYWFSLLGKRVSILGTGAIGKNIAKLLQGFNCEIKGFRQNGNASLPEYFHSVSTDLKETLNFGDVIFMALPITEKTKGLISKQNIDLLNNKFIINVGRGQLIEEQVFYDALKNRRISGAGLDAWYDYPSRDNPDSTGFTLGFSELQNVVISPHAASHAPEGKMGQLNGALDVLDQFLEKEKVMNEIKGDY